MFTLFVSSCSNESFENEQDILDNKSLISNELRSANGPFRTLGFSYDVTGENLSKESIRRPVIDIDKMNADTKHTIVIDTETGGKNNFYYGYSSLDYIKEVNKNTGFSASVSGAEIAKWKLIGFGGNLSYNTEFQSKYSYSSKYSFASVDITKNIQTLRIEDKVNNYSKYVTDKFLADLNSYTPDEFVKYYGTHVLTNITLGGHLKIVYRSCITEESNYTRKKEIVKAGINGTLRKLGLSANVDNNTQIEETLVSKNEEATIYIDYKSGDGVGGVYDLTTGQLTAVDKYSWEKSVTLQNAGLVNINWQETYPIYDFISDPTKKAQIKTAVEKYIKSKQIEMLEVKPLYRLFHEKDKNSFYTTSLQELNIYQSLWGFKKDPSVAGNYIIGYVLN